ncbi:precorrin-6y C5,15-methyltransferase (decarboxylating) subunit CbiE [Trichlorobacter lovleyi]|uniref:Precorrin-6y C5,15-methyltransferase (Decarboxylating), CbiE subunit n=1 Tax=Trichlorobacter lovleyi (strain ATCC BAA-1151 / DSM 17278 / SZ) TaxID=398767 RepID=B3EBR4_TRIL1|nr:precorrin-6y C5,15-methyltransferase (decarboxylating) subunit CbiE [Trichlorobacter lovleyi]ACD97346.1 precorrin-6y C5,15-methyltransferase (decarboxylating), CbiE subunit [Trichlorobacter lovleyi SZ]
MQQPEISLIGMGVGGLDGLSGAARKAIMHAELLIGHPRHLALFSAHPGDKIPLGKLPDLLQLLEKTSKRTAVLASGDPLYFGVGRFLLNHLPKQRIRIISNISSVQYAFALIKEPWDDALVLSAHGRKLTDILGRIADADKVCILTDQENSPKEIAQELLKQKSAPHTVWLCEDLGLPTEKATCTDLPSLLQLPCSDLNILIFIR